MVEIFYNEMFSPKPATANIQHPTATTPTSQHFLLYTNTLLSLIQQIEDDETKHDGESLTSTTASIAVVVNPLSELPGSKGKLPLGPQYLQTFLSFTMSS